MENTLTREMLDAAIAHCYRDEPLIGRLPKPALIPVGKIAGMEASTNSDVPLGEIRFMLNDKCVGKIVGIG